MGLFRRRKTVKNVAGLAVADNQPQTITVNQASSPWPGIIFTGFICLLIFIPIVWGIGVFLLTKAGVYQAEQTLAQGLVTLAWVAIVIMMGTALVRYIILAVLDAVFAHKQAMKQMDLDMMRRQQLLAQVPTAHRANEEDRRFARLIQLVMWKAYDHLNKHGQYNANDPRPWSRGQVEELVLAGEKTKVGYSMARRVRPFLSEHMIITSDNQINTARYPSLSDVQHLLNRLYDIPVTVNQAVPVSSPALRDNDGFMFTS